MPKTVHVILALLAMGQAGVVTHNHAGTMQAPQNVVHGALVQLTANGAWSWYQDERAIIDMAEGKLIVGSVANRNGSGGKAVDGNVQTTHYDLATGEKQTFVHNKLKSYGSGDDHNAPALLKKDDGNILVFYAAHNNLKGTEDDRSYYRTFNVTDETWTDEQVYRWWKHIPQDTPGKGGVTYSNLIQLSAEDPDGDGHGRIYNFARVKQSPQITYSDDNGKSWIYGGQLTMQSSNPPSSNYVNGYYKYSTNGVNRIDIVATEFHPRDANTSIYHAYLKEGKLYNTAGNVIDDDVFDCSQSFEENRITSTDDFTPVFKAGNHSNSRNWNIDIHSYQDGSISILFKSRAGGFGDHRHGADDHRLWLARLEPGAINWRVNEVARLGGQLFRGKETDYTGLAALVPNDKNVIYIATEIDPRADLKLQRHEIFRGEKARYSDAWHWTPITENSTVDNLRPIVPTWDAKNTALLWWRGNMRNSQRYNTEVVGILEQNDSTDAALDDQAVPATTLENIAKK